MNKKDSGNTLYKEKKFKEAEHQYKDGIDRCGKVKQKTDDAKKLKVILL